MFDSNDLSLDHETFAYGGNRRARRHVVDVFAAIAWFRRLAVSAKASTIAEVVRFYELRPEASADHIKWRHDQWTARSKGAWTPDRYTIAATELLSPGSAAIFDLSLWPSLRTDWRLDLQVEAVKHVLPPQLASWLEVQLRRPAHHLGYGMAKLKRRGTLDDLACLLITLRRAKDSGASYAAQLLAASIQHILLLQAGWLFKHGLLRPIVEYVEQHLFGQLAPAHSPLAADGYFRKLAPLVCAVLQRFPAMSDEVDPATWLATARSLLAEENLAGVRRPPRHRPAARLNAVIVTSVKPPAYFSRS